MSYLLDKKNKRKKFLNIALSAFVLIVLFYFRTGIFNGLSYMSGWLFRPVLILGRLPVGKAGKNEKVKMILSAILSKPNQSPYDTLIIDTGTNRGVKTGNIVFAL